MNYIRNGWSKFWAVSADTLGRGYWANPLEYFLSCIGYSVGLGNIWRFPYLLMQNGGGAFLIPYFFFLFACGMPLFFLESLLAQYSSFSCIQLFNLAPIAKGIGWSMVGISIVICVYYNAVMSWVIYYFIYSFNWVLPWRQCNQWWNTPQCFSYYDTLNNASSLSNITANALKEGRLRSSAEEFWLFNALAVSSGIDDIGAMRWKMVICFLVSWVITYLCLFRGIKSAGKIVYVTALLPYLLLTVILIKGLTLPGSAKGILFYISPNWKSLLSLKIWANAAVQIFYSLGPAWGGIITMASYNRYDHKVMRDGIVIPVICCLTSFYGGFAIFSVIGHMAHISNNSDIASVIQAGPGLAFVAYPEALAQLPAGAVFSVIFFLMLYTLGLDSLFSTFESAISGLADEFPQYFGGKKRTPFTIGLVCIEALLGLIFCTQGGAYFFQIMDWYSTTTSVVIIGFLEIIVLAFVFNVKNVWRIMDEMLGTVSKNIKLFWAFCWCVLTPLCLLFVVLSVLINLGEPVFNESYTYPRWAIAMGWMIAACTICPMPGYAIYTMITMKPSEWLRPNQIFQEMENRVKSTAAANQEAATTENYDENPKPTIQEEEEVEQNKVSE